MYILVSPDLFHFDLKLIFYSYEYYSVRGKRIITFEGERTVQDIVQFAERANRYLNHFFPVHKPTIYVNCK